ncbi:phosphoadenosine phosphosulfate reductase-like protein [Trypanosoma grayi]|uniref:phosphoadenosine phosphosulfate reductase-like protein n=1 Tax=Trypanosoma grayi TaxID=71804 RepID=UPI0004F48DCB|nr:phosphoadenosine phosphosulfate reductase-like protein [Trypanosoma grayi]KEG12489.1 phosphoadenosine phosphosulfate reductase-like protein [Trypanosoma grayi]
MEAQSLKLEGHDVTDDDVARACANNAVVSITLEGCDHVTDISALANIPTLEEAHIYNCKKMRYVGSLGQTGTALRKLVLDGTPITGAQLRSMKSERTQVVLREQINFPDMERPRQSLVKSAIDMIRNVAAQFNPEEIGVAFNGGKDSVVMMDLLQCALGADVVERFCVFTLGSGGKNEFHEVVSFRQAYMEAYNMSIVKTNPSLSMKEGLAHLVDTKGIRLVFMGTRISDSAHQKASVERTTAGWPDMLRACPVFHWEYEDIWGYTLAYGLPFCRLYTLGYTSLGGLDNTTPNPLLRRSDGTFRPAWELSDSSAERSGRLVRA